MAKIRITLTEDQAKELINRLFLNSKYPIYIVLDSEEYETLSDETPTTLSNDVKPIGTDTRENYKKLLDIVDEKVDEFKKSHSNFVSTHSISADELHEQFKKAAFGKEKMPNSLNNILQSIKNLFTKYIKH